MHWKKPEIDTITRASILVDEEMVRQGLYFCKTITIRVVAGTRVLSETYRLGAIELDATNIEHRRKEFAGALAACVSGDSS